MYVTISRFTFVGGAIALPRAPLPPAEVATMDAAFEAGIVEAMRRGSCLLMMRSRLDGHPIWTCLYPPGDTMASDVGDWARKAGIQPSDWDLFIDLESVRRAAADLSGA